MNDQVTSAKRLSVINTLPNTSTPTSTPNPVTKVYYYDFEAQQQIRPKTTKKITPKPKSVKPTNDDKYTIEEGRIPVQPLRTEEYIRKAKEYFLTKHERYKGQNIRDYTMFVLGINLARRCGDLLHMRVHNVLDSNYNTKTHILIREQKTGKPAKLIISPVIRDALTLYFHANPDLKLHEPLFPSRNKNKETGEKKPMIRENFYKKLQDLKAELEISDPLGTHSLRKTWVFMLIKNNPNDMRAIAKASRYLGHNNIETTFAYAGFNQEEMDEVCLANPL